MAAEIDRIGSLEEDPPAVRDWMGFAFDKGLLYDRDLWKYELAGQVAGRRLRKDPTDVRALVYRGSTSSGSTALPQRRDYRQALAIDPAPGGPRDLEQLAPMASSERTLDRDGARTGTRGSDGVRRVGWEIDREPRHLRT